MEEEIWKVYKETRNNRWGRIVYEVSNYGRVKKNGVLFKCNINNGYYSFGRFYVHRAVAELFIPNPDKKLCIDHINTIRTDNRVENLRWVTQKENCNNINSINNRKNTIRKNHYKRIFKEVDDWL